MGKPLFDAIEIEVIANEILVNLAKEVMILETAEPLYPSAWLFLTQIAIIFHY